MSEENNWEETAATNSPENTDALDSVEAGVENEKLMKKQIMILWKKKESTLMKKQMKARK